MSYDVSLNLIDQKGTELEAFWANHTSNTAIMWREAGCDLAEFHDGPASDLVPGLRKAVTDLDGRPEHYAQWNPANKWGSVKTTRDFLAAILDAAERWPDARVDVGR